tara:strand:- start:35 stop:871 length:837 start_codon:yes stop_codon:yes gene_type:complete
MKKFIWLASYPKSGNTMLRLFLSSYFFTDDGKINTLKTIKHITNFQSLILSLNNVPSYEEFKKDLTKVCPLWIDAQKFHAPKIKKFILLKTHNFMGSINGHPLTNAAYTKGFIYIVRDPRSVVLSTKHHYDFTIEKAVESLSNDKNFSLGTRTPVPEFITSWRTHYMSWKKYSLEVPSIIIKYEDLVKSPNIYFMKILKFLREILTFEIDEEKFKNTIKSIDFDNLKKFENNEGFDERLHGRFFRQGKIDEWRSQLSDINQKKISMLFKNEMFDLGYL